MKNKSIYYDVGSIVGLVVLILVAFFYIYSIQDLLFREVELNLEEISTQFSQKVEQQMHSNMDIVEFISHEGRYLNKIKEKQNVEKLEGWCKRTSFSEFGYIDSNGNGFNSEDEIFKVSENKFLRPVLENSNYVSNVISNYNGKYRNVLIFSSSVGEKSNIQGAVYGILEMGSFPDIAHAKFFKGNGYGYIIDRRGNVVIHPEKDYVGKNVFSQSSKYNSSVQMQMMKLKVASNESESFVYTNKDKEKKYVFFSPIYMNGQRTDLVSVIVTPWEYVFERSSKVIIQSIGLISFMCVIYILVMMYILHQKRINEKKLLIAAYQDELCKIYNRKGFNANAKEFMKKSKHKLCAIDIDIDNFKMVNGVFGYGFGDEVLKYMASIISETFSTKGIIGRIDADRFCIIASYKNPNKIFRAIENIAYKLNQNFYNKKDMSISAGIYFMEDIVEEPEAIFDKTRLAGNSIKSIPKLYYAVYSEEMALEVNQENWLVEEIKKAIEFEDFTVYYQPKFDIVSEKISGSEALIRWPHPEKGYITPGIFIPVAEKTYLIIEIGRFVFQRVCEDIAQWKKEGLTVLQVSVNMSRVELYQPDIIEFIEFTMNKYSISPNDIQIEVTETVAMDEYQHVREVLNKINEMGISIAIDDFGSGYSSLGCLQVFNIDVVKLDRSFLLNIDNDDKGINIMRGMIEISTELGLDTVCEGIETRDQLEMLKKMKCKYGQGYLFSKPIPKHEYQKFLQG